MGAEGGGWECIARTERTERGAEGRVTESVTETTKYPVKRRPSTEFYQGCNKMETGVHFQGNPFYIIKSLILLLLGNTLFFFSPKQNMDIVSVTATLS